MVDDVKPAAAADRPEGKTLDVRECPVCRRPTAFDTCPHCGFEKVAR